MARHELRGFIASAGFASGDRFVVGHWLDGPLGPMTDVMWARPDGERVLLVASPAVGDFITAVYGFDRVEVVALDGACDGRTLRVDAGTVSLRLAAGRGWPLPPARLRPAWFVRWVEGPVARLAMGVRTYGVSPSGVREWYRADRYAKVVAGRASVADADLGALAPVRPPCGFGFSEPPPTPSIVAVRPLLEDPSGHLDLVLGMDVRTVAAQPSPE